MLTISRVTVPAHSNGTLKLQANPGAILSACPEIKSLVSSQTGSTAGQFLTELSLEFSLNQQ
ncbi:MAG TPA: hypothetical protein VE713_10200 [Pyrinomonadaceae bacterium]|nr:hypothetical protein [Pyrinomonadaceae bacterium]